LVLERRYSAITKDKQIPRSMFMGMPSAEMTFLRHFFDVDGTIKLSNESLDELTIKPPDFGISVTVELYEDVEEEIVAYRLFKGSYEVWVYFKFNADPYRVKITITGQLPTARQIKLAFQALEHKLKEKTFWSGTFDDTFTDELRSGVGFDWSDVKGISFAFDEDTKTLTFNVDAGFTLDPSTVGTSTAAHATAWSHSRKCFYANGRYWVFYSDGSNLVYRTSTDGITWSDATTIKTFANFQGYRFGVWFDGAYLHYCVSSGLSGDAIFYRRGTLNSDGTITWSADEQTAVSGVSGKQYVNLIIVVDSAGYPWIGYELIDASGKRAVVTKSSANDGTWTTQTGFPYNLSAYTTNYLAVVLVPLTNQKVYAYYGWVNVLLYGRLWDGSAWGSQETMTSSNLKDCDHMGGAVNEGDDVHIVFLKASTYDIRYVKRTYGTGWGSEATVQSATTATTSPVLAINMGNNDLYCFWAGSPTIHHIFYKKCVGGTWDTDPTDWINETTDQLTANDRLSCFYRDYGSAIGLVYMTKTASPYNVRFAYLTLGVVKEIADSLSLSDALLCNKAFAVSDSVGLADSLLKDWMPQINDAIGLSDAILRDKTFQILDLLSLADAVYSILTMEITDSISLIDSLLRDKHFSISDSTSLSELVTVITEITKAVTDTIGLSEQVSANKALLLMDQIQLTENIYVNKILTISDQMALVEIVEKTVSGLVKTKIFLVMGDLAIQLSG